MKFYSYNIDTKILSGAGIAQINPKNPEEHLFPPNSTTVEPPVLRKNETAVFSDGYWKIVPDYRGLEMVEVETGDIVEVKDVGKLKRGFMLLSEYQQTNLYRQRQTEQKINNEKSKILNELDILDKKRIRAVCEQEIKDIKTGETWLDYYNAQIAKLRLKLEEIDYGT